jgi:hypothetical protein
LSPASIKENYNHIGYETYYVTTRFMKRKCSLKAIKMISDAFVAVLPHRKHATSPNC